MPFHNPLNGAIVSTQVAAANKAAELTTILSDNPLYQPDDVASVVGEIAQLQSKLVEFQAHTDRLSGASGPVSQPNLKTIAETVKAHSGTSQTCDVINNAFGALVQGQALLSDAINKLATINNFIQNGPQFLIQYVQGITGQLENRIVNDVNAYTNAANSLLQEAFETAIDRLVDDPCIGDIIKAVRI